MKKLKNAGLAVLMSFLMAGSSIAGEYTNKSLQVKTTYKIESISQNGTDIIIRVKKDEEEISPDNLGNPVIHKGIPAANVPVRLQSKQGNVINVCFGNRESPFETRTDSEGVAVAPIYTGPYNWHVFEPEVRKKLRRDMEDCVIDESLRNDITRDLAIRDTKDPLDVETIDENRKDEKGVEYSYNNDKKNSFVLGKKFAGTDVMSYLSEYIKNDVEKKYKRVDKIVRVKDAESHADIKGSVIHVRVKKSPTLEDLAKYAAEFKQKYFNTGQYLRADIKLDISDIIVNIYSNEAEVPWDGIYITGNKNSVYEIEVTHPDYIYYKGDLVFDNAGSKSVLLSPKGQKVRFGTIFEKSTMVDE